MRGLATRHGGVQWEEAHTHLPTWASPSLLRIMTLFIEHLLNARFWVQYRIHTVSCEVCPFSVFVDEIEAQGG